jgi:hypothetical protein
MAEAIMTAKQAQIFMVAAAWCCVSAHAQSVLSVRCPAGVPLGHSTGPSLALGGSGVAVQNDFFGMADNPGNLGGITRAIFSSVVSLDILSIKEGGESTTHGALSPRLLSLAIPLGSLGTFGFSLDRRTSRNYRYLSDTTISFSAGGPVTVSYGIADRGGLSVWQAGWGYAIGRIARAGLSYERVYLSGGEIDVWQMSAIPLEGSAHMNDSTLNDSTVFSFGGNGFRAGLIVPLQKFTVGCSGEYILEGDITKRSFGSHFGNAPAETRSLRLPPSLSAGVSYQPVPEWLASAGIGLTLWRYYRSGITLGGQVDDAVSVALGAQYIPAPNLLVPRYWEIVQYRAGFRYSRLPVATASESAVTLGLGLPNQQGGALFDLIFELGWRSDGSYKDLSENFMRVTLGINGGRKWFQTPGARY